MHKRVPPLGTAKLCQVLSLAAIILEVAIAPCNYCQACCSVGSIVQAQKVCMASNHISAVRWAGVHLQMLLEWDFVSL